ncbi:putative Endonuclease-reverse transcriptase-containing protein 10, partial [Homarus americanus]
EVNDKNVLYEIIVGDFNLPQIYWSNHTSVMGLNDVGTMFIEKVRDCFLTQHIEEIIRIRGDSTGNTLDLLFSKEESIVGDVKLESPLGKSDHACIYFHEMKDKSKKQVYMYEKADYLLMKQRLTMDRIQYLSLKPDIESKWNKFKRKFQAVIDECVPKKVIRGLRVSRKRTNEKLPMNRKLWAKVKKKQRLWERLKIMKTKFNERACTREMYLETEKEYRRLNNQARWETRNILKRKEKEIAKNDEEKVQKTVNDQEKADVLSEQFSRVFIKEPDGGIPTANKKDGYHMNTTIKKTTAEKDIGVVIDDKLTFSDHLAEKINMANKIMREADTTRGNTKKIYKTRARLNLRRYSFPSRVVNNWNGLPEWLVNVETVKKFEAKLDEYWKNQEQVQAQISATRSHRLSREEAIELESQA